MDSKEQNFSRISENRLAKILVLLNQLTNLTNTSFYRYTEEDVERLFSEIERATARSKQILLNKAKTNKTEL